MGAGFGFGETLPGPEEEKKGEIPQGVRGLEDVAAEALSRAAEERAGSEEGEKPADAAAKTYVYHFDERGKAYDEREARLEKEAAELKPELERTPEAEREKIGVGFRNAGFFVEEAKNNFFAGVFNKLAGTEKEPESFTTPSSSRITSLVRKHYPTQEKSTTVTTKFIAKLGQGFERDAKKARERMEAVEKTKNRETLANTGYLLGNAVKYGRTVLDIAGVTVAAPLRFVTLGAMAFARGADAAKEVRLENEKVIAKTRIEDVDKAAEEAWAVYLAAQDREVNEAEARYQEAEKKGNPKEIKGAQIMLELAHRHTDSRKITTKDLEKAYRENLPADILARLEAKSPEQPSLVNRMVQGLVKAHIERSVKRLERKAEKIEENPKFSVKERKAKRERLFNRFDRRLRDYDRVVGQFGTVDALAMGARYAEVAAKAAVYVPTAYIALEKAFEMVGDAFNNTEAAEAMDGLRETTVAEVPLAGSSPAVLETSSAPSAFADSMKSVSPELKLHTAVPDIVKQEYPSGAASEMQEKLHAELERHAAPSEVTPIEQISPYGAKEAAEEVLNKAETEGPKAPAVLQELYEKHPEFKGDTTWKVGGSGLITREGYGGWYFADKEGNLWWSGGKTPSGGESGPQILKMGMAEWAETDQMAAPAPKEMMDEFGRVMAIEKGGSVSAAAQELVKSGQLTETEFKAAWGNPESVVKIGDESVHISKVGLSYEGNEVKFIPGEGGKAPRFEVIQGTGKAMGTDADLYDRYGKLGKKPPEWLQKSVLGVTESEAKTMRPEIEKLSVKGVRETLEAVEKQEMVEARAAVPHELPVRGAADVLGGVEIKAPVPERITVGKAPEMKLPEWLTERVEYAKLAETLPEKTAGLEALEDNFGSYSLAAQEHAVEQFTGFEKQLTYLEKHADTVGLTPEQEDFVEMSKGAIKAMHETLKDTEEAFKERLEDLGVPMKDYRFFFEQKKPTGTVGRFKEVFEQSSNKEWAPFMEWVKALKPEPRELSMNMDAFLRARFKD
ncbi:MAG: hypothetical protein Q8P88_01800 [Candidatus Jorgensenbacteria bacterium]|nr:hypothetical protein [Candidatus Jorgensenbacteria bacterium]